MSSSGSDLPDFGDDDALEGAIAKWMNLIMHELGHVLISHLRGGRPRSVEIARGTVEAIQKFADPSIECNEEQQGRRSILLARDSSLDRNTDPVHRLEVVVAGWVAERVLGGLDRKEDATNDLERAKELVEEISESQDRSYDDIIRGAEASVEELIRRNEDRMRTGLRIAEAQLRKEARKLMQLDFELEVLSTADLDQILGR